MASRNRVIYQSEALFVSDDVNSLSKADHDELIRVQGANYGFTINRTDVNQFGNLARIDSLVLEPPTVNFDFSYYLGNGKNESALGFSTTPTAQFVSGFLESSSGKNFYIVTSDEGQDATTFNNGESYSLIGIGNAYLSDYTIDLSVGSLPTASVSFEASNINSQNGIIDSLSVTGNLPSVNPSNGTIINGVATLDIPQNTGQDGPTALRPGDVVLSFPGFDGGQNESGTLSTVSGAGGFHVQSASISIPLSRSPISKIGSKFPFARVVDFPVNATMSVNAVLNTMEAGNLANSIAGCGGDSDKEVAVTLKSCEGDPVMAWTLKGATLDSESWSSSIGSNKSVDLTFGVQIGGIDDIDQGIIFSGDYTDLQPFTTVYDLNNQLLSGIEGDIPDNWHNEFSNPETDIHRLEIGSTVENIGFQAFENNSNLSGILTIPKNVRYIGQEAFRYVPINGLVIENGLTGIGSSAFANINNNPLNKISGNVTIPDSVVRIDGNAFNAALQGGVDTVYVGAKEVGQSAFYYTRFKNLILGPNVETIEYQGFGAASNGTAYITGLTNNSTNLKSIGNFAFRYQKFTGFNFNEGITGIGQYAFDDCDLRNVTIPDSVTDIGTRAFGNNTNLKSIEIRNASAFLSNSCFFAALNATGLVLGPNIQSIGPVSFQGFGLNEPGYTVEINCPTGVWSVDGFGSLAYNTGFFVITGAYFQDYTGSSWSGDQHIAAGSKFISGTY